MTDINTGLPAVPLGYYWNVTRSKVHLIKTVPAGTKTELVSKKYHWSFNWILCMCEGIFGYYRPKVEVEVSYDEYDVLVASDVVVNTLETKFNAESVLAAAYRVMDVYHDQQMRTELAGVYPPKKLIQEDA